VRRRVADSGPPASEKVDRGGSVGVGERLGSAPGKPPDLRLAGLALASWLSALASLHLPIRAVVLLALLAAVAAVVASVHLLNRRSDRMEADGRHRLGPEEGNGRSRPGRMADIRRLLDRQGWLLVGALLGVLCGSAATAARLAVRDADPLAGLAEGRGRVTVELVVRDDPKAISGAAGGPSTLLVPAELSWLRAPATGDARIRTPARILVLASNSAWRPLLPGQRVMAAGRLSRPRGGDLTAAVLSVSTPPTLLGRPSWPQRAAGSLRAGLQRACAPLPDEPGGLLPGLVVGDTSRLDPGVEQDFRTTGMTHLNAVSGSNVAIVIGLVLLLARWSRAGPWLAAGLCGTALVGFVILARPSPSVVRAAVMGAIGLLALATGRPRAALPALGAAITVLVLVDPDLAGDPGFTLSVLATGGLLLLAPRWRDALRRRGVPPGVAEALVVPAAAQLACTPVIAGLSGTISLVAVPANLLAAPAIAPATVLGVIAAVISPVWPAGAEFAAWLASWPARWLVAIARHGAQLPAGTLPWIGGVAGGLLLGALTVALLIAVRRPVVRRLVAVVAVAVVLGALPVRLLAPGWPPSGWVIAVCAVGQGDSIVLPVAAGQAVVIDAGPEPAAVDGCLRRLGVRVVPLLVISHFHADHVGGVDGVFRGRRVAAVVAGQWPEPATGRDAVRAAAATGGAPVDEIGPGWTWTAGGVRLTLVGPAYPVRGSRSDPNNNSLVLRAQVDGVRILLPGDAEEEEQREMLDLVPAADLRADVLKVAHHGSAYQEPAFLDAVRPGVALVSVGRDNGYGHPNLAVLARLARNGARVLRTDTDGDLAAVTGRDGLAVVVRRPDPGGAR
jgi:competence protein ComEC